MRPVFLVVDPPSVETLSTRKLVLESAKFNVVTAFTAEEALEIAEKMPVDGIVFHSHVADGDSFGLVRQFKAIRDVPVILLTPEPLHSAPAEYVLSSYEPMKLVELLQRLFGDPSRVDRAVTRQSEQVHRD